MNPDILIRNIEIARDTATQFSMLKEDLDETNSPVHKRLNDAVDNIIKELESVVDGRINRIALTNSFFPYGKIKKDALVKSIGVTPEG